MTYLLSRAEPAQQRLVLGAAETAKLLAISERKLNRLTQSGEVPSLTIAGCRRYSIDSLRAYVLQREQAENAALSLSAASVDVGAV